MIHNIILNGRTISYDLQRKNVKNVNLRIKADQSVIVSANKRVSVRVIEDFLKSKSDFILNAIDKYAERNRHLSQPKIHIDGEKIALLGQKRKLMVFKNNNNHVEIDGLNIKLFVKNINDIELKKSVIDKWLKNYCEKYINQRCVEIYKTFEPYGITFPQIKFRKMVSRWGSCNSTKNILTFNTSLIEPPAKCIDYVVMHEFTHFLHPNHSKYFYSQLSAFMPDWKQRKILLDNWYMYAD